MPKKVLSKKEYKQETRKRDYYDPLEASLETQKFRQLCLSYRDYLKGLAIEVGKNTFYFDGAGDHKIMFRVFLGGIDSTQYSLGKFWVVYGKEPKYIRQAILKDIAKLKKGEENVFKESFNKIKQETESRPEEKTVPYPEDFIKASDLI